jgi:hypothetical protein
MPGGDAHESRRVRAAPRCITGLIRVACVATLCTGVQACADLTRVSNPDLTTQGDVSNATGAEAVRSAAVAQFASAYTLQILFSGLIADEFNATSNGQLQLPDSRVISALNESSGSTYPYDGLSLARIRALNAIQLLNTYNRSSKNEIAELFAFLGYVETFFAEDMCDGVPIGLWANGRPQYGPNLNRDQLVGLALVHFDSALAYGASSDSIIDLVKVGRGRALLDSGNFAAAAAAVNGVPVVFQYTLNFGSTETPINQVYQSIGAEQIASVSDREGTNGLDFIGAADPRVITMQISSGVWLPQGDAASASPVPLATGVEAQLIDAEAQFRAGSTSGWTSILSTLRQTAIAPAMDTLPSDSTTAASPQLQLAVFFRERAFWLFATGHRQGDLRRLIRVYGLAANAVFPTGSYAGGVTNYGNDITYVPFGEQFNPNFTSCTDRNP